MQIDDLICWYNSQWIKIKDIPISILDFGFIHSEATYDVYRVKEGRSLFFERHEKRFRDSCEYFGFESIENVDDIAKSLLGKNQLENVFVWMCVWRGRPDKGGPRERSAPQKSLVYIKPYYPISEKESINLSICTTNKRVPDDCISQKSKNFGWLEFSLAQREAENKGFDSSVLLTMDNFLCEGPGFSICFVKDEKVYTPRKDCLGSITVSVVKDICGKFSIPFFEEDILPTQLDNFDEVFICSTSGGVTSVSAIDEIKFKTTKITSKIKREYDGY